MFFRHAQTCTTSVKTFTLCHSAYSLSFVFNMDTVFFLLMFLGRSCFFPDRLVEQEQTVQFGTQLVCCSDSTGSHK